MTDVVVVHRIIAADGWGHWRTKTQVDDGDAEAFVRSSDGKNMLLTFVDDLGPVPTFGLIREIPGAFVVKIDLDNNPGTSSFSHHAGDVFSLGGDAEGYSLVIPDISQVIIVDECEGLENANPDRLVFRHDRVDGGLFRSTPRPGDLYCAEYIDTLADPVVDMDDYYNMEFPLWLERSGSTGFRIEEVWRKRF